VPIGFSVIAENGGKKSHRGAASLDTSARNAYATATPATIAIGTALSRHRMRSIA